MDAKKLAAITNRYGISIRPMVECSGIITFPDFRAFMHKIVEMTRRKVNDLAITLDSESISRIPTSRNLEAVIDRKFVKQVSAYRWYAHIPQAENIYAVANVDGQRVSLQRLVLSLANPEKSLEQIKHVSFKNKFSFDCRVQNLLEKIGRQSVMRNRKPKRNTSSKFKGVRKIQTGKGSVRWRGQIKANYGTMSLGTFEDEKWAATIYDAASYLLFEGSGFYNFPEQRPDPEALEEVRLRIARFHVMQAKKEQKQKAK